ncbi:MAG: sulfatase family protein [Planctomycetota bacterium]|jgi:arylsulfatase A-like enzyme
MPPTEKPNIIYLMADDLGLGDVTVYDKSSTIPTPNMERLARKGITFTDAHSPAAVCSPTRYSVLSGRYPFRCRDYGGVLRSAYDEPLLESRHESIAQMLKRGGYRTAAFGKWHVGMNFFNRAGDGIARAGTPSIFSTEDVDFTKPITDGPTTHGFDHFFGIGGSINHGPYSFIEDDRITVQPEYIRDEIRPSTLGCYRQDWFAPGWSDAHQGARCAEKAVEFIKDHTANHEDEPFFIYHAEVAPHWPHVPPKDILGQPVQGRGGADDDIPERCDMIVQVDAVLGAFMACLEELGIADNTLLILTSDNGADTGLYEPIRGRKGELYEGGHRIPFIARWPGQIPAGATSDEILGLHDLAATFAAAAGITPNPEGPVDSANHLPALLGETSEDGMGSRSGPLILTTGGGGEGARRRMAIRQGPWKLLLEDGAPFELYNLAEDLKEAINCLEEEPDRVQALLDGWQKVRSRAE